MPFDKNAFAETIKTASAIANLGPDKKGYIIIGILDRPEHAVRFENLTRMKPIEFAMRYICGIDAEAAACSGSLDRYNRLLVDSIKAQPIKSEFANQICERIQFKTYRGKSLIIFDIEPMSDPILYNDEYWTRHGSSTIKVAMGDVSRLVRKFAMVRPSANATECA